MALQYSKMIPLGSEAANFDLKGIDENTYSLKDFADKKILVIIFMCNHCPYVQKMWDDLVKLSNDFSEAQFVGINSNANPNYPEDSFEKMKEYAAERKMVFPYLYDETQEVARAYSAQCTPDIYVFNSERKLVYRGAFEGVLPAIEALQKNQPVPGNQVQSMGCSIKWQN
mgnify:FL=1